MIKCALKGCARDARHQIGMRLWPIGVPRDLTQPSIAYIGLGVCDKCRAKVDLKHFLSAEGKARMQGAFQGAGRIPPDFERAELVFHRIDGGKLKGVPS